jgi:hypothetical protein
MAEATGIKYAPQVAPTPQPAAKPAPSSIDSNPKNQTLAPPQPSGKKAKVQLSEDDIRQRAYEIFAAGGYQHGNADADWLAAERELQDELD